MIHAAHYAPPRGITVVIKIFPSLSHNRDKLADVELHWIHGGPLDGLKLCGFALWKNGTLPPRVTLPTREYTSDGLRRSYTQLRPITDPRATNRLVELILQAWDQSQGAPV